MIEKTLGLKVSVASYGLMGVIILSYILVLLFGMGPLAGPQVFGQVAGFISVVIVFGLALLLVAYYLWKLNPTARSIALIFSGLIILSVVINLLSGKMDSDNLISGRMDLLVFLINGCVFYFLFFEEKTKTLFVRKNVENRRPKIGRTGRKTEPI